MGKIKMVCMLLGQWRHGGRREIGRIGFLVGLVLICMALLVRWPKEPPRIEPFIYAHF
jgi:hypothetical protein